MCVCMCVCVYAYVCDRGVSALRQALKKELEEARAQTARLEAELHAANQRTEAVLKVRGADHAIEDEGKAVSPIEVCRPPPQRAPRAPRARDGGSRSERRDTPLKRNEACMKASALPS